MQLITEDNVQEQPYFNIKEVLDTNSSGNTTKNFYSQTNKTYPRIVLQTSISQIGKDIRDNIKFNVMATITVVETSFKKASNLSTEIKGLMKAARADLATYNLCFSSVGADIEPFKQGDTVKYGAVLNYIFDVV